MHPATSAFLGIILGAGVGAGVTYLVMKKDMERKINEEVKSALQPFYENKPEKPVIPDDPESEDIIDETPAFDTTPVDIVKMHSNYNKTQNKMTNYMNIGKPEDSKDDPDSYIMKISEEEFGEEYKTETWTLYSDKVVTGEDDNPISDIKGLIGITVDELEIELDEFGEAFYRNSLLMIDFEIYAEEQNYYPPEDDEDDSE